MIILLAGGGSGGHILPNLALQQELKRSHPTATVVYMGEYKSMEEGMAKDAGIRFYGIHAGKMRRYFSLQNIFDWFKVPLGCVEAFWHIVRIRPDVAFSKGGYVSVPVAIACFVARVPLVIHESDVRPGLATRICGYFARTVCVSWEETINAFPSDKHVVLTGVPVRESLLTGSREAGRRSLGIQKGDGLETKSLPLLMVTGGSLGASDINNFIANNVRDLLSSYHIFHLTGKGKSHSITPESLEGLPGTYTAQEFGDATFEDRFTAADIVLSRAGTTYLAEFAALGKRVILVPLPKDRSRGDQIDNAISYKNMYQESTVVIQQEDLTIQALLDALDSLSKLQNTKHVSPSHGAKRVVAELLLVL